jgi:hypothetical protein
MKEPCEKEHHDYMEAMRKWDDTTRYLQSFISIEPLVPGRDVTPIPFEEYSEAVDAETAAHQEYLEKMEAYFKCREVTKG